MTGGARRAVAIPLVSILIAGCGGGFLGGFEAFLIGASEVPPVSVSSTGRAVFDDEGDGMRYSITLSGMTTTVTAAHIHGPAGPGVNAGIIITLFSGSAAPPVNGLLVQGTFNASSINPASGVTWGQLRDLMANGGVYVNVHTTGFPDGELRGQIRLREDR